MWFFGKDKTSYLLGLHNTFTVKTFFGINCISDWKREDLL